MDAGHFGLQVGQHPSISMEQHFAMNRYGTWRDLERTWVQLLKEGNKVNVQAVFVEGDTDGTFSPYWCVRENINDNENYEYILTNDENQI